MRNGIYFVLIIFFSPLLLGEKTDDTDSEEEKPCPKGPSDLLIGAYYPQCDKHGYYQLLQCHGSIGSCWCVNKYGKEVAKIFKPDEITDNICDKPCFRKLQKILLRRSPLLLHGEPIVHEGSLPSCDEHGYYRPVQGNENKHFCVDKIGQAVNCAKNAKGDFGGNF